VVSNSALDFVVSIFLVFDPNSTFGDLVVSYFLVLDPNPTLDLVAFILLGFDK
jgi:hypothetical protein